MIPVDTAEQNDTTIEYLRYSRKRIVFLAVLTVALFFFCIYTLTLGDTDLSISEIFGIILNPGNTWNDTVVWDLRLPRIVAALLAGAALGLSGAVMQSILRNPLASPFTLGISNASAFGAALGILITGGSISLGTSAVMNMPAIVTLMAFVFAMVATLIIILLVKLTNSSPEAVVLAGLAINSIFAAGLAFTQFIANDTDLSSIVFWQFGSLDKVSWNDLWILFTVLAAGALYFIYKRWDYNALEAGEEIASGLGINVSRTRITGLAISAVITAVAVSFMGIIGFIGLIAPHLVRRVIGTDNRYLLVGSMLVGAAVLLLSYVVSQYAFSTVIPVGILTSAIGGPLFLYLLIRGYKRHASS